MTWFRIEDDPDGGWWQCPDNHRARRGPDGRPIPLT